MPHAPLGSTRLRSLDVLRAVAVLLVLGRHKNVVGLWNTVGWIGVDLFFVLSGFLVSGLLFAEYRQHGSLDLRRFLARRGFKIYPAFYLLLLATLLHGQLRGQEFRVWEFVSEALFIQNYGPSLWIHTWSLAVEEHFYLLLALGLWLLTRHRSGHPDPFAALIWIIPMLAVSVLLARTATTFWLPYTHKTHTYASHLRVDALLFGVLLGYLHHFRGPALSAWVTRHCRHLFYGATGCILPCAIFTLNEPLMTTIGLTLLYLGMGGVLVLALYQPVNASPGCRAVMGPLGVALSFIGSYSYPIYLWHMPVLQWGEASLVRLIPASPGPIWEGLAYVGGSILAGVILGRSVERPVLTLRDRLFPSGASLAHPLPRRSPGDSPVGNIPRDS